MANPEHIALFGLPTSEYLRKRGAIVQLDLKGLALSDIPRQPSDDRLALRSFNLHGADLSGSNLHGTLFQNVNFRDANLSGCKFDNARFAGCNFSGADLSHTEFKHAQFENCDFRNSDIRTADFYRTSISGGDFEGVRNADRARNLDTAEVNSIKRFDRCVRSFSARNVSWESIRNVGRLSLFAVSLSILGVLIVVVQCVGIYNEHVQIVLEWVGKGGADHAFREAINGKLKIIRIPMEMSFWFVGLILLSFASAIYSLGCPDEVKEFTRVQWELALDRPLLHYWALSWKHPRMRYLSGVLYVIGGIIVVFLTLKRLITAFTYIIWYGSFVP